MAESPKPKVPEDLVPDERKALLAAKKLPQPFYAKKLAAETLQYLKDAEQVLGLQPDSVGKALTKRKIKAGAEFVDQDLKLDAANDGRDALSKAIYSKLFDYLIVQINQALAAGEEVIDESKASIIGVVDIFGFEVPLA